MPAAFTCTASWSNLVDSVDVTREAVWSVLGGDGGHGGPIRAARDMVGRGVRECTSDASWEVVSGGEYASVSGGVLTGGFKLWYEGTVGENDKLLLKSLAPKVRGAWVPGLGGYLFGVVKETDPEYKPYAIKRCLPFALLGD